MLYKSTILTYSFLVLLSIGRKSFANLGRIIEISGRAVAMLLLDSQNSFIAAQTICQSIFSNKNKLYLICKRCIQNPLFVNLSPATPCARSKLTRLLCFPPATCEAPAQKLSPATSSATPCVVYREVANKSADRSKGPLVNASFFGLPYGP
jgi:hypothetical protein